MKKLTKLIAVLCAAANFGTLSASALSVTAYDPNDERNLRVNLFPTTITEDWLTAEDTNHSTDFYKARLMWRDQSEENPCPAYVDAENGEIVLPIVSEFPAYTIPLDVQDLKQISKLKLDNGGTDLYLGYDIWYEPAEASTKYTAESTSTGVYDAGFSFVGVYTCKTCGEWIEFGEGPFALVWNGPDAQPGRLFWYNENHTIGIGRENKTRIEFWSQIIPHFTTPCTNEACDDMADLKETYLKIQPSIAAFEGEVTDDDYVGGEKAWNKVLKPEKIGKLHISDFTLGSNAAPGSIEGQQVVLIQDPQVYINHEDGTYEFKAKFINFTQNTYTPCMILAAYKGAGLQRIQIGGWGVNSAASGYAIRNFGGDPTNYEGAEVYSGRMVKTDINGDGIIDDMDAEGYNFDEVKGFIWDSLTSLTPAHPETK